MPEEILGRVINGRYRVDASLGKGGMADVYKVWDKQRSSFLAMKVLEENLSQDPVFVRRFKREAKNLEALRHNNIVRFFDLDQDDLMLFLTMEYIDGTNLRAEIMRFKGKPGSPADILRIMVPVCMALNYAHLEGVVHCDVKPANIMIEKSGRILLADFGIARNMEGSTTTTLAGAGTPAYMSPEQIRGKKPTPQTDIYALGTILFEMLTGGERPFTGEQAAITGTTAEKVRWEKEHLRPISPSRFNPGISAEMEAVVLKCLEKNPRDRYKTTLEFLDSLRQTEEMENLPDDPSPTPIGSTGEGKQDLGTAGGEANNDQGKGEGFIDRSKSGRTAENGQSRLIQAFRKQPAVMMGAAFLVLIALVFLISSITPPTGKDPEITPEKAAVKLEPSATERPTSIPTDIPTKIPETGDVITSSRDGMEMIYIPAGNFMMGAADGDPNAAPQEQPRHRVKLNAFYIDKFEVTNDQFGEFVAETGYVTYVEEEGLGNYFQINGDTWVSVKNRNLSWMRPRVEDFDVEINGDHPVVQVNWEDARAYCEWAGRRLPTEAEWEKAAHADKDIQYPWGNSLSTGDLANVADRNWKYKEATNKFDDGYAYTAPVGSFPAGAIPYGVMDMTGNVWEWVYDFYGKNYYSESESVNPQGPSSGSAHVVRGGSWWTGLWGSRVTLRSFLPIGRDDIGFRCAKDAK